MDDLPHDYQIEPELRSNHYVVFTMINSRKNIEVTTAFGLPSRDSCSKPPQPFRSHPESIRNVSGSAARPLICFAGDSWHPADSPETAVIRSNMESTAAAALCSAVYDDAPFEDFVCFD
jgi:hypothetical protein